MYVKGLCKSFGGTATISGFGFEAEKGDTLCIMGASGCGKTTLLNILTGLLEADSGELSDDFKEKKSVVFQEDRLCMRLNALANVKLVCHEKSEDELIKQLAAVGLERENIFKPVSELSGGMRRRTAIVRAVEAESSIIIMDEPFKGLDKGTHELTAAYVAENKRGRTVIAVTHDLDDVTLLGGRLIEMPSLLKGAE